MTNHLHHQVMLAAQNQGISSVLFRNAIGRRLGLNIADAECLSLLSIKGSVTPTEVAKYTNLSSGSTTALLDRLEKAHYIRREPNPHDRRGVIVKMTSKFQDTAGPLVADVQKAHMTLLSSYTPEQLKTITHFLEHFTDNVTKSTAHIEKEIQ